MKRLLTIPGSTDAKISYSHMGAFLITLPFDRFYSELVLISFLLHTIIHINRERWKNVFSLPVLIVSSMFFVTIIGMIYSADRAQAMKDLQRQAAILLFPVLLLASSVNWRRYKKTLLFVFSVTCLVTIVYLYFDAFQTIRHNGLPLSRVFSGDFINHSFSRPIALHATYLSMYVLLSACIFLYLLLGEINKVRRVLYLISIGILLCGLVQLASRSVLISAIIIAPCFPFVMLRGKKRLVLLATIAAASVVTAIFIWNNDSFKTRYVTLLRDDLVEVTGTSALPEPRAVRWRYAMELVESSPLFGYGSGSEKRLLQDAYFRNKLYNSFLAELNAHNQYLSVLLKTGAWGLFIFLATLSMGFRVAWRERDILFLSFMIIISIVGFSENILDVNKGIFFYACFFSLFMLSGKPFEGFRRLKRRQERQTYSKPVNTPVHAAVVRSHNHL
jgi:O-antigen ligase